MAGDETFRINARKRGRTHRQPEIRTGHETPPRPLLVPTYATPPRPDDAPIPSSFPLEHASQRVRGVVGSLTGLHFFPRVAAIFGGERHAIFDRWNKTVPVSLWRLIIVTQLPKERTARIQPLGHRTTPSIRHPRPGQAESEPPKAGRPILTHRDIPFCRLMSNRVVWPEQTPRWVESRRRCRNCSPQHGPFCLETCHCHCA